MKKWFALGGMFFTAYLVFLIATIPVSVALNAITLPKNIAIQGVSGTVWQATIQQVDIKQKNKQTFTLLNVESKLSVWSLLLLNPTFALEFGQPMAAGAQGKLTVSNLSGDISISDGKVLIAANAIAHQLSLPLPVTAKGDVILTLAQFTFGKPICQLAQGDIHWSKAGVIALDENIKLGELHADIGCKSGALVLTINPKNNLGLSFTATVKNNGNITGKGFVKPGANFPRELDSVLPFLGQADNKGRYQLKL